MPTQEVLARGWLVQLRNAAHARYAIHDSGADEVGASASEVASGPYNQNDIIVIGPIAVVTGRRVA